MFLLTCHGTVMCVLSEGRGLAHLAPLSPGATLLDIDPAVQSHPLLGPVELHSKAGGTIALERYGQFLSAKPDGTAAAFDSDEPGEWEIFLPITPEQWQHITHILSNEWATGAPRRVIPPASVGLRPNFKLAAGPALVDLTRHALAADGEDATAARAYRLPVDDRWLEIRVAQPEDRVKLAVPPPPAPPPSGPPPAPEVAKTTPASPASGLSPRDATLLGWAMRETAFWQLHMPPAAHVAASHDQLNNTRPWAAVYEFADSSVRLLEKPASVVMPEMLARRAQSYLRFFQEVAATLPAAFATRLCLGLNDHVPIVPGVPLFGFQRHITTTATLLLPDIDFLVNDFYQDRAIVDDLAYNEKDERAVFAGSTTGGLIDRDTARLLALPRLRAARFFAGNSRVDFRLPQIVQTTEPEAAEILAQLPFCQVPPLSWKEQFKNRFVLSMDGNGATCSRVAIALQSNSVLLKYNSEDVLFYFGGLQPWVHYVPVAADADVEPLIDLAARETALFEAIAAAGRSFARTYLSRDAALFYTASLLQLYAASLGASPATSAPVVLKPQAPRPATPSRLGYTVAHIQQRGDVTSGPDGWAGTPGSGLWIEGFSVFVGTPPANVGVRVQAVLADRQLSPAAKPGAYVGTRGLQKPVLGLVVWLDDDAAAKFRVSYEAVFTDGSADGPVPAGEVCQAATGAPLEALRVIVTAV